MLPFFFFFSPSLHPFSQIEISSSVLLFLSVVLLLDLVPVSGFTFHTRIPLTVFDDLVLLLLQQAVTGRCSVKELFLEILQNLQENTSTRVSFRKTFKKRQHSRKVGPSSLRWDPGPMTLG